jgi:sarcosine oxidase subunit beta
MQLNQTRASVVIVGAGIIGVSIAYNLAKDGVKDVVIFEKSKAGSGSTSAALGGFRHQFSNELSIRLSKESIEEIENFKDRIGYDPLVTHDGYLFIASKEESMRQLEKNRALQSSLGVEVELLDQSELRSRFPFYSFEEILGGTLCMEDGHASTFAIHQGYLSVSKELGVQIYENTPVTKIESEGSRITGVVTPSGRVATEKVVIASGAYSGLVGNLASVSIPITPYPRRILVTKSFSGIPAEIPLIIDADSTLVLGREGSGMIMSINQPTKPSFELNFPPNYDEKIISMAVARIPALAKASIGYAVQGLYEMTPDANPIVSPIPEVEGLFCCAGFAGHGFMHAPAIGRIMSEMITGKRPHLDVSSFSIDRFKQSTTKEGLII